MTYDPYASSFPATRFDLELPELAPDGRLPHTAWAQSGSRSPAVRWDTPPAGTQSIVLTAVDPDAPIAGGFWHWLVVDIPGSARGLEGGAGAADDALPAPARHLQASMGQPHYAGVRPPAGTGTHRLFVCATALDVPSLPVPVDAGAAQLQIAAIPHTLGRAIAIATSHAPPGPER